MLKRDYGFDEAFDIFEEMNNNHHKLNGYNPGTSNIINRKNEMLEYLKIIGYLLIDMLSTLTAVRKVDNSNYKGYEHDKLKKESISDNTCHTEAILDCFKFKRLQKIKTEEPQEGDEVKYKRKNIE